MVLGEHAFLNQELSDFKIGYLGHFYWIIVFCDMVPLLVGGLERKRRLATSYPEGRGEALYKAVLAPFLCLT